MIQRNSMSGMRARLAMLVAVVLCSPWTSAGLFDDPQNLKVLPEDISAAELRDTMKGFAFATGARCETCHVGEAGQPLSSFDFPADDKQMKNTARIMLRLVRDINDNLAARLDGNDADIVKVECVTCHRGQRRPRQLADDLMDRFAADGMDAALARYRTLKDDYYGSHTFDFSEWSIIPLAQRLAGQGHTVAAQRFLDLNIETNPRSVNSLIMQGQLHASGDDNDAARERYQKALAIEPQNDFVKKLLQDLE